MSDQERVTVEDHAGHLRTIVNAISYIADSVEVAVGRVRQPGAADVVREMMSERIEQRAQCIGCLAELASHHLGHIEEVGHA